MFKEYDSRKIRHPHSYVKALETRLAGLEAFWKRVKYAPVNEKLEMLKTISFNDHLSPDISVSKTDTTFEFPVSLDIRGPNTIAFYGPTNVYGPPLTPSSPETPSFPPQNPSFSPLITDCLKLFFKWQYPQFLFINREAFLVDYYYRYHEGRYCSEHLLYAMCAIGSRMSVDPNIAALAKNFYQIAWNKIIEYGLGKSHITSIQCLLCLGYFNIGMGNTSLGWMLSGMAFRMGQDLGFQLNPRNWSVNDHPVVSPADAAVRSRIYWGSYVTDIFISFVLGRPTTLKKSDTSIPDSESLPDFDGVNEYRSEQRPSSKRISMYTILCLLVDLSNVADAILLNVFAPISMPYGADYMLQNLGKYNLELAKWHLKLPSELRWKKSELRKFGQNPDLSVVCLYYNLIKICLNRPFLSSKEVISNDMTPKLICQDSIEDIELLIKYRNDAFGINSVSLVLVYAAIVSCSVLLMLWNDEDPILNRQVIETKLNFFLIVLVKASKVWDLATKSIHLIKSSLLSKGVAFTDSFSLKSNFEGLNVNNSNSSIAHESANIPDILDPSTKTFELDITSQGLQTLYGGPPILMTSASHSEIWKNSLFSMFNQPNDSEDGNNRLYEQ